MKEKIYTLEDIEVFNKMLDLNMSEERKKDLLPVFQDWMRRAAELDRKMSRKPFVDILPSNIFQH